MVRCSEHDREITQDHELYYSKLVSLYGHFVLGDLCLCNAIISFRDKWHRDYYDAELKRWKRHQEIQAELDSDLKRKREDKLEAGGRWYLITFTRPDTEKDPTAVLKSTQRLLNSKQVSPVQWCYSLELTEKGTPHTHIRLFSNKYFEYKKVGNFNDGFRYDIQKEKFGSAKYVIKEESKPDQAYLDRYKLTQYVWQSENYVQPTEEVPRNEVVYF